MPNYCTAQDVRLALAPIADYNEGSTAAGLTDQQINDAIDEAEGTIDAYIKARYQIVPIELEVDDPDNPGNTIVFTVAPVPLRGWTRDIAAFLAALTFRKNKDLPPDDPIRLRFNMVMGFLTAVRDHDMSIPGLPPISDDDNEVGVYVENLYNGHLFDMKDFGLVPEGAPYPQSAQPYWPRRPY